MVFFLMGRMLIGNPPLPSSILSFVDIGTSSGHLVTPFLLTIKMTVHKKIVLDNALEIGVFQALPVMYY